MAQSQSGSGGPLTRWARFAATKPKRVVLGWVIIVAILGALSGAIGGEFIDSSNIPGAESQKAIDLLDERFPAQSGDSATLVFQSSSGVNDPTVKSEIDAVLASAAALPNVVNVASPFEANGAISADGTIAYAAVLYDESAESIPAESVEELTALVDSSATDNLRVEVGGQVISASEEVETGTAELIGIAAAIVILLITFGSVIAMGLPIITALVGVVIGTLVAILGAAVFDLNTITTAFVSMMGLGVGIDYSLFIVTRFREGRHKGMSVENAVVAAIDSAGRAVLFAGSIVVIAMLGLFIIGIPFVGFLGAAAAGVVIASVLVANGLLPAILGWVGPHIDRWTIPTSKPVPVERTVGFRLVTRIQKRPLVWLIGALVVIGAIAYPITDAQVGTSDAGNDSETMHTRRAYDLLATGFGPGFNGPLTIVVNDNTGLDQTEVTALSDNIAATANVAAVNPAIFNETGDTAVFQVIPGTSPQDTQTEDLIKDLRNDVIPADLEGSGAQAYITGPTAANVDIAEKISDGLPLFIALVAGLSIIILMAVFRSVFIPIKAALLNLLSFAGAYGVLTAVFTKGWGASWVGVDQTGPIESFLPMILFGILFGLSMDYEVFLVSRIRESYLESKDTNWALSHGIGSTGRVIIAAGAIMVSVFASFALGDSRVLKEFGIGLASAIFIDVAIVRMIIVPSVMTLAGRANWWFPSWLDRILPRLDIEGGHSEPHAAPAGAATAGAPATITLSDGD
ncbi:MMPL family transporter [soil metagenome]